MQSWGTQSRFRDRDAGLEPSKSGVIGLLCAALGRERWLPVDDLAALRMGVRVDRPGAMLLDYHTAMKTEGGKMAVISPRYYLSGASFLVGMEGNREILQDLNRALARPRWQLFLGRKAFVPSLPLHLPEEPPLGPGLRESSLEDALEGYPAPGDGSHRLRFVMEDRAGAELRMDTPLSFAERRFATRTVRTDWKEVSA